MKQHRIQNRLRLASNGNLCYLFPVVVFLFVSFSLTSVVAYSTPPATISDVHYGVHERQVLDFWKATSSSPTPVVIFIHGGGWIFGDKTLVSEVERYLEAGISVVSINYRYTSDAHQAKIFPPVRAPLEDAARALQFVRSKASDWNIDKDRIAATGRSAGACTSLWLALHDDMADPTSDDPIARESTRLSCAAVVRAQTTLDPQQMRQWTPNSDYGGQAFGFTDNPMSKDGLRSQFAQFLAARKQLLPSIEEYSPIAHVSADDPPIFLLYDSVPSVGKPAEDPTHTANFGVLLQEKLKEKNVEVHLVYPGTRENKFDREYDFILYNLVQRHRTIQLK